MSDNINPTKIQANLFKKLLSDKPWLILFIINLVINGLMWLSLFWQIKPRTEPVYLHYNIYFGIDMIGSYQQLYYMPLSALGIFLFNLLLAILFYNREKAISFFLLSIGIIAQIVIFVATILIILLNI